jgi:hypothetical protein
MSGDSQTKKTHRKKPRGGLLSLIVASAIVWYVVMPLFGIIGFIWGVFATAVGFKYPSIGTTLLIIGIAIIAVGGGYIVIKVFRDTPQLIGGVIKSVKEEIEDYLDYAGLLGSEGDGDGEE